MKSPRFRTRPPPTASSSSTSRSTSAPRSNSRTTPVIKVEVAAAESSDADVDKALDELRGRFGTLKSVDRPAADGDFLTIDITATIDGDEVDSASGLSYQVGAGTMLEGLDEAVTGLSADEDAIFDTTLVGGDHAGESAQVKVVVKAVKERELPEANDDFAQLASEFDTLAELREDLAKQAADSKTVEQGVEARDKVLDKLVELVEVPGSGIRRRRAA